MHECLQVEHPELRVVNVQPGVIKTFLGDKSGFPAMDDRKSNLIQRLFELS